MRVTHHDHSSTSIKHGPSALQRFVSRHGGEPLQLTITTRSQPISEWKAAFAPFCTAPRCKWLHRSCGLTHGRLLVSFDLSRCPVAMAGDQPVGVPGGEIEQKARRNSSMVSKWRTRGFPSVHGRSARRRRCPWAGDGAEVSAHTLADRFEGLEAEALLLVWMPTARTSPLASCSGTTTGRTILLERDRLPRHRGLVVLRAHSLLPRSTAPKT